MMKKWVVALIGVVLFASACSSDATGSEAAQAGTAEVANNSQSEPADTTAAVAVAEDTPSTTAARSIEDERPEAFGERCGNDQLPVLEQLVIVADGGLRARQLPGDGDVIDVLPDGTIVDTIGEGDACGVLSDGSVWLEIGTPLLATGGWVHSGFLQPVDDERDPDGTASGDDDRTPSFGERCGNDQLPVLAQLVVVVSDGGLNARAWPGDGDVVASLPNGTIVDTIGEGDACGVLDDGSVWFEIGTPLLATGGWVHSDFLKPTDS